MNADDRAAKAFYLGCVRPFRLFFAALALGLVAPRLAAAEMPTDDGADADEAEDVTILAPFSVKADRVEDFGVRVLPRYDRDRSMMLWPVRTPLITAIVPNTAASKAGLKPGERILRSDGQSTTSSIFSMNKWQRLQQRKWAEVTAGKRSVTWTLEVEAADSKETRTVKLIVPTPPPRWGSSTWQKPEGRRPAVVAEPGPLAEFARSVLDNGIWMLDWGTSSLLGFARADMNKFAGYGWTLGSLETAERRVFVSQQRGRTDIVFIVRTKQDGTRTFFTSPSGALEKTWSRPPKGKAGELPLEEGRAAFQKEMDFWLTCVGRVTGRWPFELIPDKNAVDANLVAKLDQAAPKAETGARATSFLKLTPATEAQRALFKEAFAKIGADEDHWAYTETSHGLDDKHIAMMRVDPSKPDAQRCTLLKLDGKPPTPAEEKRWRDEGRDTPASLGELPPISNLVEMDDVRVSTDETAAVVFELPLRASNPQFPAEKFQALFRVNKTQRAFEDIVVKMRESWRVAGVVSISEAGMEVRFQTFDPKYAPQPVWLKAGGAVRLLLVKFSRSFEATRTDFKRVEPYAEPTGATELPELPVLLE